MTRGLQDRARLLRSFDRKVSPRGTWQESRGRWVPTVGNSFGLPPRESCPGATRFCVDCYATGAQRSSGVAELLAHNLAMLQAAGTATEMAGLLVDMIDDYVAETAPGGRRGPGVPDPLERGLLLDRLRPQPGVIPVGGHL